MQQSLFDQGDGFISHPGVLSECWTLQFSLCLLAKGCVLEVGAGGVGGVLPSLTT